MCLHGRTQKLLLLQVKVVSLMELHRGETAAPIRQPGQQRSSCPCSFLLVLVGGRPFHCADASVCGSALENRKWKWPDWKSFDPSFHPSLPPSDEVRFKGCLEGQQAEEQNPLENYCNSQAGFAPGACRLRSSCSAMRIRCLWRLCQGYTAKLVPSSWNS